MDCVTCPAAAARADKEARESGLTAEQLRAVRDGYLSMPSG